jgi:hypothetical protein
MGRRAAGLIAATVCLSFPTACAHSASDGTSGFLTRALHVCTVYYDAAYALPPPIGTTQLEEYPSRQQRLRRQRLSGLRAVAPPALLQGAYKRYLSNMARLDELYASAIDHLKAEGIAQSGAEHSIDERAIESLVRHATQLESRLDSQARALGLANCARNPYTATHYSTS